MPTLNERKPEPEGDQSKWFIVTSGPDHPLTFQVKPEGYKWLLNSGLSDNSDLDWDVFEALHSLDLLYTLDSPYTPEDAPMPDNFSFEEIPDKERMELAEGLLVEYRTEELCSQKETLEFLLSVDELDAQYQQSVLETILSETPIDIQVMIDHGEALEVYASGLYDSPTIHNNVLLSLVFNIAYEAIDPREDVEQINEGNPVWTYEDWVVCAGTELIFHEVKGVIHDAIPDLLLEELNNTAESIAYDGQFYSFLMEEFSAICEFQFIMRAQDVNPWLGSMISDGLEADYTNSVLILPNDKKEKNGAFRASDEPGL